MKWALVSVTVVCAAALLVMTQSSASQIPLTGAEHRFSTSLARLGDAADAMTPSTSGASYSVQVSGSTALCAGASLTVTAYHPSAWAMSTGTATVDFADLTRFLFGAKCVGEYTDGAAVRSLASASAPVPAAS